MPAHPTPPGTPEGPHSTACRSSADAWSPVVADAVCRALLADPSGRVAQLARARPTLISLWVNEGLPVEPIVRGDTVRALVGCLADAHRLDVASARRLEWWVKQLSPAANPVPLPTVACYPVPPSDAPADADARDLWYRAVATVARRALSGPRPSGPGISAVRYISRHYEELDSLDRYGRFASVLGDYTRTSGNAPDRSATPAKVYREVTHWDDSGHDLVEWRRELVALDARGAAALPPAPWPDELARAAAGAPARSIVALRTARELYEESVDLGHCAFSLLRQIMTGAKAIYSVRYGVEHTTVCLTRDIDDPTAWAVSQHRGWRNLEPGTEAKVWVNAWAARVGRPGDV